MLWLAWQGSLNHKILALSCPLAVSLLGSTLLLDIYVQRVI
jgi:hypothetical protein